GCVVYASECCSDWHSSGRAVGACWCGCESCDGGPSVIGYVGVPGALVSLPYRGGLSASTDRPVSFARTLGGKRKAFMGARGRREWGVSFDLVGSREVAGLVEVARSAGEV